MTQVTVWSGWQRLRDERIHRVVEDVDCLAPDSRDVYCASLTAADVRDLPLAIEEAEREGWIVIVDIPSLSFCYETPAV